MSGNDFSEIVYFGSNPKKPKFLREGVRQEIKFIQSVSMSRLSWCEA